MPSNADKLPREEVRSRYAASCKRNRPSGRYLSKHGFCVFESGRTNRCIEADEEFHSDLVN